MNSLHWSSLFVLVPLIFLGLDFVQPIKNVGRKENHKHKHHVNSTKLRSHNSSESGRDENHKQNHHVNGTKLINQNSAVSVALLGRKENHKHNHHVNGTKLINQDSAVSDATVSDGCAVAHLTGDTSSSGNPTIPEVRWMELPSVVRIREGQYRVLGRNVNMRYVKEQLEGKGVSFPAQRQEQPPALSLEILADSLFIQGTVQMPGLQALQLFTRKIISSGESELDVSAPQWNQQYQGRVTTSRNGEPGYNGIPGPQVEIFADVIQGSLRVISNGGNGFQGQDGGDGTDAPDNTARKTDKPASYCTSQLTSSCNSFPIQVGAAGRPGGNGGNAGTSGDGGNSGSQRVFVNTVEGNVELRTCQGTGAPAARNGQGGDGGLGGEGAKGRNCVWELPRSWGGPRIRRCGDQGATAKGARGRTGAPGSPGTTPNEAGSPGTVSSTDIQSVEMDTSSISSRQRYPMALLNLLLHKTEDLLWAGNMNEGRKVLRFIKAVTSQREDAREMFNDTRRRLGLLRTPGFDMFGKNELFAPRIKWEALKKIVEGIREFAQTYEESYNSLSETIETEENFEQLVTRVSAVAGAQVTAEKNRLIESRLIAESEKRLYVQAIGELENSMNSIVENIQTILADVVSTSRFNTDHMMAVLQSICGFVSAAVTKDPLGLIDVALGAYTLSETHCPVGSLETNAEKLRKWLTFGKSYQALEDSSDLDFDRVDVSTVPEVMMANLEMNKEGLANDLICLLDVRSREQDVSELKMLIENFFISGAARIDLIAKIVDLDNDIGGLNFDIPLLEETDNALTTLTEPTDTPELNELRSVFMENLLRIYQELEGSFMKEVYGLYKAFRFRTLWETQNPLPQFQRIASEGARGRKLNGILEMTNVLRNIQDMENRAVKCFTNNIYTTDIERWGFSQETHETMFEEIHTSGSTTFNINVTNSSCTSCFNIRLVKLYIELTGDEAQASNVPLTVHLMVRHLSASFFRQGNGTIKEYRQPLGSFRKMKFRRSAISNEMKCGEKEMEGYKNSIFCVTSNDDRWQPMCSSAVSQTGWDDSLLGEEECRSPYGTYELVIPVDRRLSCDDPGIRNKNCRDLDLNKFTSMNVWAQFYYWSEVYPTGPDDRTCLSPVPPRTT